jgi:hypothetical protein
VLLWALARQCWPNRAALRSATLPDDPERKPRCSLGAAHSEQKALIQSRTLKTFADRLTAVAVHWLPRGVGMPRSQAPFGKSHFSAGRIVPNAVDSLPRESRHGRHIAYPRALREHVADRRAKADAPPDGRRDAEGRSMREGVGGRSGRLSAVRGTRLASDDGPRSGSRAFDTTPRQVA